MRALETTYAGYRFRSRLEARWAVFLDHSGLPWMYEPQSYLVRSGLHEIPYLPDFWLPSLAQWAEVKGFLEPPEFRRLIAIAQGMGGCRPDRHDMVILGYIPRERSIRWPVQLHRHGRELWAAGWVREPGCPIDRPHLNLKDLAVDDAISLLIEGFPAGAPDWALDGLDAARRSRFEWGENG